MRQIVLDTETTGLEAALGHRVIEIGCVELVDRRPTGRVFHKYLNPDRESDPGALEVHGLTSEFLADKPRFEDVVGEFIDFVRDAELVIHNANFDLGFLNAELARLDGYGEMTAYCGVCDTLVLARKRHPGQRVSLDALCKRYQVDNSQRTLHGALLDAEILADVYLAMTGGQAALSLGSEGQEGAGGAVASEIRRLPAGRRRLPVVVASPVEQATHEARLAALDKAGKDGCLWLALMAAPTG
ncbi:MAG: DNA polymerase III subunit epsilon [Gammaproteobacteria bacterium]